MGGIGCDCWLSISKGHKGRQTWRKILKTDGVDNKFKLQKSWKLTGQFIVILAATSPASLILLALVGIFFYFCLLKLVDENIEKSEIPSLAGIVN